MKKFKLMKFLIKKFDDIKKNLKFSEVLIVKKFVKLSLILPLLWDLQPESMWHCKALEGRLFSHGAFCTQI